MSSNPPNSTEPSQKKIKWGVGFIPEHIRNRPHQPSLWETLPQIKGRSVKWIDDIRDAPEGEKCKILDKKIEGSELLLMIKAVVTDRFTLYLEKHSFEGRNHNLLGGLYLDTTNRSGDTKETVHIVKFDLASDDINHIDIKVLGVAKKCQLVEPPKILSTTVQAVDKRQELKHNYYMRYGRIEDNKLKLWVKHPFPVTGFRLEYVNQSVENYKKSKKMSAELFAIEDHNEQGCSCERKGWQTSMIEFDLEKFDFIKAIGKTPYYIYIWGPNDDIFGSPELTLINGESNGEQ